jgi:ribosomal protein L11 methyltransferase
MAWIEVKFQTVAKIAEYLEAVLESQGALAITLQDAADQPIYEPEIGSTPIWDEVVVTGLFDESSDMQKITALILNEFPNIIYKVNNLEDQEWQRTWMQDFLPMQFGERLWIIPSYQTQEYSSFHVILDPGLAFGTGKHPTTALCLRWLDKNIQGGETVIDYGCGSGILAIAALKVGAQKVYAVDHDPQAIHATLENADRNSIPQESIVTLYPKELTQAHQADVLIANILANPLIELVTTFAAHLKNGGHLVLSGILKEQLDLILEAYQPHFTLEKIEQQEDWLRIDFTQSIHSP